MLIFEYNIIRKKSKLNIILRLMILEDCFWQDNGIVGSPVRGTKDFHIMGILSAEDCKSECQADEDCDFWVWNGPAYGANINTCWLKSSMESNEIQVGKISGPKCCPGDSCYGKS